MKKMIDILSAAAAAALMAGCATRSASGVAAGAKATSGAVAGANGQLEVFSDYSTRSEGSNPTWRQHSDYYIYRPDGRLLDYVANAPGYYSSLPRLVRLPAGKYIVKARGKGALWTRVPVVIKPQQITRVNLDGDWQAGAAEPLKR